MWHRGGLCVTVVQWQRVQYVWRCASFTHNMYIWVILCVRFARRIAGREVENRTLLIGSTPLHIHHTYNCVQLQRELHSIQSSSRVVSIHPTVTCSYELILKTRSPVAVLGASIELTAELYENGKPVADGQDQYRYTWRDNAIRTHKREEVAKRATSNWTVSYPADQCSPGKYTVELVVERFVFIYYYTLTSSRLVIELSCKPYYTTIIPNVPLLESQFRYTHARMTCNFD